jgi:hypothetical protein
VVVVVVVTVVDVVQAVMTQSWTQQLPHAFVQQPIVVQVWAHGCAVQPVVVEQTICAHGWTEQFTAAPPLLESTTSGEQPEATALPATRKPPRITASSVFTSSSSSSS